MAYTTIDDPSAYFQTTLYSGTGSAASVTNSGNSDLQPDFIWIKNRNGTRDHRLIDSTRGPTKEVVSNGTAVEYTEATVGVTTFQSDGFAHGGGNGYGASGETYASWQWKANGGSSSASAAESGSNVAYDFQVNTTSKFMINAYTGTGSSQTLNLGNHFTPEFLIIKNRSQADSWAVYHHKMSADPDTDYMQLDTQIAVTDDSTYWEDVNFAADEINLGTNHSVGADAENYICYAWSGVQGYSKFGSYTGNGNANGPFVYTGFKPAYLMIKSVEADRDWTVMDNKRPGYNPNNYSLKAQDTNAEYTGRVIDLLSNGFKLRETPGDTNTDGHTFIYIAFAHQPFVTSGGVPCTAR